MGYRRSISHREFIVLIQQNPERQLKAVRKFFLRLFLALGICFCHFIPLALHGADCSVINMATTFDEAGNTEQKEFEEKQCKKQQLVYYLYISDFAQSFIAIPTSNVSVESSTLSSKYLAGRAAVYDKRNRKVGTCSASFLCMQNQEGIYTDISNFLSVDNGLIVSWFTPTTLVNLELDSIIHSMVTECQVVASTKVGFNPFFGKTFDLVVSSDDQKIYFKFSKT